MLLPLIVAGCGESGGGAQEATPAATASREGPTPSASASASEPTTTADEPAVPDSCGSLAIRNPGPLAAKETAACLIDAMVTSGSVRQKVTSSGAESVTEVIFAPVYSARVTTADSIATVIGPDYWSQRDGRVVKGRQDGTPDEQVIYKIGQSFAKAHSPQAMKRLMADYGPFDVAYDVVDEGDVVIRLTGRGNPTVLGTEVTSYAMVLDDLYRPARITSSVTAEGLGISADSVITYSAWGKIAPIEPPT